MNSILTQLEKFKIGSFQTIIILINEEFVKYNDLINFYKKSAELLKSNGSMWIFSRNIVVSNYLIPLPLLISKDLKDSGFFLKNIIVYYNQFYRNNSVNFENRYSNFIFITKEKDYKFNKDPIREKHIWKDVEWSGGRKSRYNEKGKDPSNVWLKTKDNGMGKITEHIMLSKKEAIERIIKSSTEDNDKILLLADNFNNLDISNKNISYYEVNLEDKNVYDQSEQFKTNSISLNDKVQQISNSKIYVKSSERMDELPDKSIQTIITSPPYWGLRDYSIPNQIGFNSSYAEYLKRLNLVWKECFRALNDSGTLWININKRLKEGNMILFPVDFYVNIEKIGFKLIDIIIWHKPIAVSAYGENNLGDRYEFILLFAKSPNYKFNKISILESPDYIHLNNENLPNVWKLYRKIGNIGKEVSLMIKKKKIRHTAIYPKELVRRIILLCSEKGDTILDPFAGSGTTLVIANKLFRKWIGYEINPDYAEIIKFRIKTEGEKFNKIDDFF